MKVENRQYLIKGSGNWLKFTLYTDGAEINSVSKTANSVADLFGVKVFKNAYDAEVKSRKMSEFANKVVNDEVDTAEVNQVVEEAEADPFKITEVTEEGDEGEGAVTKPSLWSRFKFTLKDLYKKKSSPRYRELEMEMYFH